MDPRPGKGQVTEKVIGHIIGALIGIPVGIFLGNWLYDKTHTGDK